MIAIQDLVFEYGRGEFRLRIPELVIEGGRKGALIGPSGSGKTTFLNLVSGIALPRAGTVRVNDHTISTLTDAARRAFRITNIGFVFQDFELLEYLNVLDNILHPYRINRALQLTAPVRARARELAESTGLGDMLHRRPHQLSHGEKQRAAICRALLAEPRLILADEPTGNLDPTNKDRILDLLIHHARQAGATLLVVTHDLSLLNRFDEVIDFQRFHDGGAGGAS
jgi:ABC-type lipoprotein export system ATPase subunit